MNVVMLIGNLATDVELRESPPEKKVASFLLAVDRRAGRPRRLLPRLDVEPAGGGVRRVPGEGITRSRWTGACGAVRWEDADGKRRSAVEVVANRVEFLAPPRGARHRRPFDAGALVSGHGRTIIAGRWPAATRSSRSPTSCSTVARSRSTAGPGLQVVGADEVTRIACGVSSSRELFERAGGSGRAARARPPRAFLEQRAAGRRPRLKGRLEALFAGDLTLVAYHLALDAHPELGNNALLARAARRRGASGRSPESALGAPRGAGRRSTSSSRGSRAATGREPLVFAEGPERIERVAIVTRRRRHDGSSRPRTRATTLFVTGEPEEPALHDRARARHPLPGRRPLRDRDVRRQGARARA